MQSACKTTGREHAQITSTRPHFSGHAPYARGSLRASRGACPIRFSCSLFIVSFATVSAVFLIIDYVRYINDR
ncbi:MAG: hypothetical protein A3A00_00195 [Candidatus Spechtbacteria bacterium RIFCSPLOWO2_01_FULL_38_20]|nr:MAG: hypothetical protein A3A00_00195 [Candidatus Spechtbacteria bacterium RIFCSPLOWO2_01_FULL_38_20]